MSDQLNLLRQAFPHRRWHHLMLVIALVITAIPIAQALEFRDPYLLQVLAFGALILYWMLQFRLMQSAVYLSRKDMGILSVVKRFCPEYYGENPLMDQLLRQIH